MSYRENAANKLDETTLPLDTKNVLPFPLFLRIKRISRSELNLARPGQINLLSDVRNNAIIARCFHPQISNQLPGASGIS